MSVEKLSNNSVSHIQSNPYAQIMNDVIEHIKDNDAFRIYCFLYSKSRDWTVIKSYAEKICGTGNTKAKKCWSYLARCGLIKYITIKDEKGKIVEHDIMVLNGTIFNKDEPFIKPKDLIKKDTKTTGLKTTRVEKSPLLKKDLLPKLVMLKKKERSPFLITKNNKENLTAQAHMI